MKPQDHDTFYGLADDQGLALLLVGEASICDQEGRIDVGSTLLNRVDYGTLHQGWGHVYGKTIEDCEYDPNQYSCLNSNDPNYQRLLAIAQDFDGSLQKSSVLQECLDVARGLIAGTTARTVKGIFYETHNSHGLWNQLKAKYGRDPVVEKVDAWHRFYADV